MTTFTVEDKLPSEVVNTRRGLLSEWEAQNPVLDEAEFGFVTDTGKFKIGDGSTVWSRLPYFSEEVPVLDTGWRKFPEQEITVNLTGQSGVVYRISLLQRRIGNFLIPGLLWARDTVEWTATAGSPKTVLTTPDGFMVPSTSAWNVSVNNTSFGTLASAQGIISTIDNTIQLAVVIYGATAQAGVTPENDYTAFGLPTFVEESFPDILPGVAYTP